MLYFRCILIVFLVGYSPLSTADWINLTGSETAPNIAEIYVLDDHVKVKLEVYVGDLGKFEELLPDEWVNDSIGERPSLEKRMHTFATERLQFITDEGVKLPAKLELVEPRMRVNRLSSFAGMINPITGQKAKEAPEDKRVLYAEIVYPFEKKPKQLIIVPPMDDQDFVTATIGFVTYHKAVPVIDFRYLVQPATLNLNWEDPWYTKFDHKNLKRHHKYPLMLFLYVEPRQVRLESLLRVGDIEEMTGFSGDFSGVSAIDKRKLLQEHVKNYYADKKILQIDGSSFKPDSIRVEFLNVTLSGLKVIDISKVVDESSLLVGTIQQYFIDALPQTVDTRWQYFNQRIDRIPVIVTDPVGPFLSLIDTEDPDLGWQNFLKKYSEPSIRPVDVETGWSISIPFIGETTIFSQPPDQQEALVIVGDVLENLRVAFIEKEPDHFSRVFGLVHSEPANSEQAEILQSELSKLFSPNVSGGGASSVQAFYDLQVSNIQALDDPNGFRATISGLAHISALHWGHVDQREFQFQLLFDLIEADNQWRLSDLTVIDIKATR